MSVIQVLVDADNVDPARTRALLDALAGATLASGALVDHAAEITVAGHPHALARTSWPPGATVVEAAGWQRADLVLAAAYRPGDDPLVLVSGDGDFGLLVGRHAGPVLVVSEAASYRLEGATVVDPAVDGVRPIEQWLRAVSGS